MKQESQPDNLAKELQVVESEYGISADDPLALLAASLRLHDFPVKEIGDLDLEDKKPWSTGRAYGPYAWLYSHLARTEDDTYGDERQQLTERNLQDRGRLLDLLAEFYSTRKTPLLVRLIVSDMAVGSSMLKSQGADVMTLPDRGTERTAWLKSARDEMTTFAEFLISKYRD